MTRVTPSDVYDLDKKTGALWLGKNRLDDYAATFLKQYCPEALETPMALPVDAILENMGLVVKEASLSSDLDIFGCCLLLDGEVPIYDKEKKTKTPIFYPKGTILVDPETAAFRNLGAQRNTLIHEALHWHKDKTYFKILAFKEKEPSPLLCRRSEIFYEPPEKKKTSENQVRWLEWQANRLAPRVLMPKDMFQKKAKEVLAREGMTCDDLVETLADFFLVSRLSVKYRLQEVGLEEELKVMDDYEAVFAEIKDKKEYVKLTLEDAIALVVQNKELQQWLTWRKFIFVDGYFVRALSKCVQIKDDGPHLTALAKKNLKNYVLNITEQKKVSYPHMAEDIGNHALYCNGGDAHILAFHPEAQKALKDINEDDAISAMVNELFYTPSNERKQTMEIEQGLEKMIGDPNTTLCQCLYYVLEKKGWTERSIFMQKTLLDGNYLQRIRDNVVNTMKTNMLMTLCVAFQLRLPIIDHLFKEKAAENVSIYREPYSIYHYILECKYDIGLETFNKILEKMGKTPLKTMRRDKELNE